MPPGRTRMPLRKDLWTVIFSTLSSRTLNLLIKIRKANRSILVAFPDLEGPTRIYTTEIKSPGSGKRVSKTKIAICITPSRIAKINKASRPSTVVALGYRRPLWDRICPNTLSKNPSQVAILQGWAQVQRGNLPSYNKRTSSNKYRPINKTKYRRNKIRLSRLLSSQHRNRRISTGDPNHNNNPCWTVRWTLKFLTIARSRSSKTRDQYLVAP